MEPEETVMALKIREGTVGILYEERREGEKAWSSRGVWRKEKRPTHVRRAQIDQN